MLILESVAMVAMLLIDLGFMKFILGSAGEEKVEGS